MGSDLIKWLAIGGVVVYLFERSKSSVGSLATEASSAVLNTAGETWQTVYDNPVVEDSRSGITQWLCDTFGGCELSDYDLYFSDGYGQVVGPLSESQAADLQANTVGGYVFTRQK